MILQPNIATASIITQTRPEFYVTQILPSKQSDIGVTFTPALIKAEVKLVRTITSQSDTGAVFGAEFTGAALRSIKHIQDVSEKNVQLNADILGSTVMFVRNILDVEEKNVEVKAELLSAELNANFNRGYSLERTDAVLLSAVVTGATLLQRT